ncbi:MAG TPA: sugar ABC transporter permease [Spirochaetia bacterium]|nr:sugar ABC transporter permease [Spirochaetia bacterium]
MKSLTPDILGSSLGQVGTTLLLLAVGVVLIEVVVYTLSSRVLRAKNALVHMLLAPAVIGLALLVVYPICWEVVLAFSNMSLRHFRDPTFSLAQAANNFALIFSAPVLKQVTFFPVFLRTILWTVIQVTFHVGLGLGLALLLNRRLLLKGLYKVLLVIPWAIPQVISCLTWRGEYHYEYGFLNIMLRDIGLPAVQWKSSALWNFIAMNITNIWLGVPFMMVICLGGLQSISKEYYEAAKMDGATGWKRLRSISLPLMAPILTPAVILGVIWTFNNFNVPYFINENNLETSDILVTALFRAAFEYNRYGFSAAFAIVIFLILFLFSAFYIRFTGALRSVRG